MKKLLTILLIIASIFVFGQSVPNTVLVNQTTVYDVIHSHAPATANNLLSLFANANSAYFDPTYNNDSYAPAGSLKRFRNYTVSATCPAVGDSYQGGIVAYVENIGGVCHGVIAAPTDIISWAIPWGCIGTSIPGALGTAIYDGSANTAAIIAGCGETYQIAYMCDTLTTNGYTDWVCPSLGDLQQLYINQATIGGFTSTNTYWSSSEQAASYGWAIKFDSGSQIALKNATLSVRAVRYF